MSMYIPLFSAVIGLIALVMAIKTIKYFGAIYRKSFMYTVLGILFLVSSHLIEVVTPLFIGVPAPVESFLEHILFGAGMLSLAVSYYILLKSLEEVYKDAKNPAK